MRYFSIPSDFKVETIDRINELNNTFPKSQVIETYGQVTQGALVNSGRVTEVLPELDFNQLEKYVQYSVDRGIDFNYTLNPACLGNYEFSSEGAREINSLLTKLNDIGIKSLTLTTPSLMELVKASGYKFKIKASAICEITSPGKALFYKKMGVERIVIDPDITRDFNRIKGICEVFEQGVEMIVNNVCYKNCAYKMFHYNHESHCTPDNTSQKVKDYYFNRCSMQKAGEFKNPVRLNWVRPEDIIYYYETGVRYFKLQGRQNVLKGDIVATLKHYFKENFEGNLFELITLFAPYNAFQPNMDNKKLDGFLDKFFKYPEFCREVCSSCNYCESYAKKCMDVEKTAEIHVKALEFYNQYDEYTKLIKGLNAYKPVKKLFDGKDLECNFDF